MANFVVRLERRAVVYHYKLCKFNINALYTVVTKALAKLTTHILKFRPETT
jgi:hypothetical protein